MKTKTMTMGQLTFIGNTVLTTWEENKGDIKIKGRPLFNLIGLKKEIEKQLEVIRETIATMAEQYGGVLDQQIGGYKIPEDRQEEANQAITEFTQTSTTISYTPIVIGPKDEVPVAILDALFEYIEMAE